MEGYQGQKISTNILRSTENNIMGFQMSAAKTDQCNRGGHTQRQI